MQYDRVIEQALRDVQNTLSANRPPGSNLPDDRVIGFLRVIINAPEVQRALECGSDTALNFVLRGVNHVLSETTSSHPAMINRLRDLMDRPERNRGFPHDTRMNLWLRKPPAR
jgi:hypothetical protein